MANPKKRRARSSEEEPAEQPETDEPKEPETPPASDETERRKIATERAARPTRRSRRRAPEAAAPSEPEPKVPNGQPREEIEQLVLSINKSTGEVTKVERLDPATGKRAELDQNEYAAMDAYLLGMIDCAANYMGYSSDELSPEELAYAQGVLDYDSYL